MKRLSLIRSLELCKDLWSWLRDNSDVTCKYTWPKWSRYTDVYNFCFACEFDLLEQEKQTKKGYETATCEFCPLKGLWGNDCTRDSSSYTKWCYATTDKSRQKYAGIIANFCDKELKKLAKKEKSNGVKN